MSLHHLAVMTQLSRIPILSPVLFMHIGDPFLNSKNFTIIMVNIVIINVVLVKQQ